MADFIKGKTLSKRFYREIVQPILYGVVHDAALVGEGSDVLGYDQPISMDHDWGPRLTVFVADEKEMDVIRQRIVANLPDSFMGFPIRKDEEVSNIQVTKVSKWLQDNLKIEDVDSIPFSEWLSFPQQHLLQFTKGVAFSNELGHYEHAKKILSWYPNDVWRWMMASQWYLIWSTEHLILRTVEAGDYLGSRLIIHKLIRTIVEMCFLQSKEYKPYDKWLGSAFKKVDTGQAFEKIILEVIFHRDTKHPVELLQKMLFKLGNVHNMLHLSEHVEPRITKYEVGVNNAIRPYFIFNSHEYKDACVESIENIKLKESVVVGAIDQLTNVTDAMINFTDWKTVIKNGYELN